MTDNMNEFVNSNMESEIFSNRIKAIVKKVESMNAFDKGKLANSEEISTTCSHLFGNPDDKQKTNYENRQMEPVDNPFAFFMDELSERTNELYSSLASAKKSHEDVVKEVSGYSEEINNEQEKLKQTLEELKNCDTSLKQETIAMSTAEIEAHHAEGALESAIAEVDAVYKKALFAAYQRKENAGINAARKATKEKNDTDQNYQDCLKNIKDEHHEITEEIYRKQSEMQSEAKQQLAESQENANLSYQKAIALADNEYKETIRRAEADKKRLEEANNAYKELLKISEEDPDYIAAKKEQAAAEHMHAEAAKSKQIAEKQYSDCKNNKDAADFVAESARNRLVNAAEACRKSDQTLQTILGNEKAAEETVFRKSAETNESHAKLINARKVMEAAKRNAGVSDSPDHDLNSAKKNYADAMLQEKQTSGGLEQAVKNLKVVQKKKAEAEEDNHRMEQARKAAEKAHKEKQLMLHEATLQLEDAERMKRTASAQFSRIAAAKEQAEKKVTSAAQKYSFRLRKAEETIKTLEDRLNSNGSIEMAGKKKAEAVEEAQRNLADSLRSADQKLKEDLKNAEAVANAVFSKAKMQRKQAMSLASERYADRIAEIEREKQHQISVALGVYSHEIANGLAEYHESISTAKENLTAAVQKKKTAEDAVSSRKATLEKTEQELHSIARRIEALEKEKQQAEEQERNARALVAELSKKQEAADQELRDFRTSEVFSANVISKYDLGSNITLAI